MTTEEDKEHPDYKPFSILGIIKVLSILFVLGIYAIIFLKIMFLK